jgi:hypothetical protein
MLGTTFQIQLSRYKYENCILTTVREENTTVQKVIGLKALTDSFSIGKVCFAGVNLCIKYKY